MSYVFHRHNRAHYPVAVKGDGIYLIDDTGKRYIDGCCGAAVSCLGHSEPVVRDAIAKQINELAFAHSGFFTTQPMEELAQWLVERAPEGIERVYFVSGGSEAVEASIKLAKQYFHEKGETQRHVVIGRWQSYHGNTIGALSAGGNRWRRQQYASLLVDMSHIDPCYAYRGQEQGESLEAYGLRMANQLEAEILAKGPENVLAFVAEPVVGATLGCVPAAPGYFKRVRDICKQYGILLILDEVMCGMGRTGSLFACEQEGITADIITVAKGLGGGYQPIGAMMVSGEIYNIITDGSGFFQHGHTYLGHATACAASLAVQKTIEQRDLLRNVVLMGEALRDGLHARFSDHPHVGDIRGRGLFYGVEFVADKASKTPFPIAQQLNKKIKQTAMDKGLMCYAMGGTVDGQLGDHVMFAPPFIINQAQIDEMLDVFADVVDAVFAKEKIAA